MLVMVEFFPIMRWTFLHCGIYKWFAIGFVAFFILRLLPFIRRNEEMLQTFTHELTHTIVAVMFFRKIHYFHAEERSGVMGHSGGKFGQNFITLAPYCLPIFTYVFLLLRIIGAWKQMMWF